jgi:Tol biopolymer transport system component
MQRPGLVSSLLLFSVSSVFSQELYAPEEGGTKFVQISQNFENVAEPLVYKIRKTSLGRELLNLGPSKKVQKVVWYPGTQLALSPDGKTIAYIVEEVSGKNSYLNIFTRSTEGGRAGLQRTFGLTVGDLGFSPDGKNISFTDNRDGNFNVYEVSALKGSSIRQLTNAAAHENGPVYSPDGKTVYYCQSMGTSSLVGEPGASFSLWSFSMTNGVVSKISEGFPSSISADGKILYMTKTKKDKTGLGEIWSLDVESGQENLIMADVVKSFATPQISPDGKTIVATSSTLSTKTRQGNVDIVKFNVDGSEMTQLTYHPANDLSPVWSNDGKSIYFITERGANKGMYNIFRIDLD